MAVHPITGSANLERGSRSKRSLGTTTAWYRVHSRRGLHPVCFHVLYSPATRSSPAPNLALCSRNDLAAYPPCGGTISQARPAFARSLTRSQRCCCRPLVLTRLNTAVKKVQIRRREVPGNRRPSRVLLGLFFSFAFRKINSVPSRQTGVAALLLSSDGSRLRVKIANYESDIYTQPASKYDPLVVWQFWGRAAGRPELSSGRL